MASQARNGENEVPIPRKLPNSWNTKPGHLSPDVQDVVALGQLQRQSQLNVRPSIVESRVRDLNASFTNMSRACSHAQWNAFTEEFFEPGAHLIISITLENGINRFQLNRTLIPRFFMTYYECIVDPQFILREVKLVSLNSHTHTLTVDCPNGCLMTTHPFENTNVNAMNPHGRQVNPDFASVVRMDCRYFIEFATHSRRFQNLSLAVRNHQELLPRHILRDFLAEGSEPEQTRSGIPNHVISFLRMCNTMGPMQDLIMRHKQTAASPKESLRAAVVERFQQITNMSQRPPNGRPSPPVMESAPAAERANQSEFQKPAAKQRRRRKQPENAATGPPKRANRKANQQPPAYEANHEMNSTTTQMNGHMRFDGKNSMESEDSGMMLVGSPVIMGTGIRLEEERYICKMENTPMFTSDGNAAFSPQGCSPTTNC